jgi:parvulin-like peptidyl-prolyl isomerase
MSPCFMLGCVVSTYGGTGAPLEVPPKPTPVSSEPAARPALSATPAAELEQERISARHILVSYRGALRAAPNIVRSREEAFARAGEALKRAKQGEAFEALVQEYSDDLGSAARGGDLGEFSRQDMVAEFAETAFKLEPGQLSDIVETQFGFHVILRTK